LLESDSLLLFPSLLEESLPFLPLELLPVHPFSILSDPGMFPLGSFKKLSVAFLGISVIGDDLVNDGARALWTRPMAALSTERRRACHH
jgi:hypothetical protein